MPDARCPRPEGGCARDRDSMMTRWHPFEEERQLSEPQRNQTIGADRPPNIVLIVSDDHGFGDLGFRGTDPAVSTPHLDALAADGRVYDNAYVTAPICSPSRAGLITGVHQARWGAHWFTDSAMAPPDRKSTRLNSSHVAISYAVFCLRTQ